MSHSLKDGKRGGGHLNTQNKEVWSKRCGNVSMWSIDNPGYKRITHRYERRAAKRQIREELSSDATEGEARPPHS